jgi:hypothetical protein
MKTQEQDFVALFNAFWYRDFPFTPQRIDISRRALWTTHIASTVKQCADHLGLFTCFETGGKTDAVIQYANAENWAKVEWEWLQPNHQNVNEIIKLANSKDEAEIFIFIGYSNTADYGQNVAVLRNEWEDIEKPLLVFLITFSRIKGKRKFDQLQTHLFRNNKHRRLRKQKALPWEVERTKWFIEDVVQQLV